MISIIHPSRSRPEMAAATMKKWKARAAVDVEYILSCDSDDPKLSCYDVLPYDKILVSDNKNAVQAINRAARKAVGDIFIVVSDDFDCPYNWEEKLDLELEGKEDFLLKTKDGIQNYIVTLPIMDRKYYERFGYIYPPEYTHMFCDTHITCVGELTGRLLRSELLFQHNHYSRGGVEDEISKKANLTWKQGEDVFINFARNNFGLSETSGRITDKKMIHWIKQHAGVDYSNPVAYRP